jgi:hypothetical protein
MLWNAKVDSHVPMPWGNVDTDVFAAWGQWAGGIGSLLAVVALVIITGFDARRRRREQQDAQAAQARTVTGILGFQELGFHDIAQLRYPAIKIENHGTRPILDVVVESVGLTVSKVQYRDWYISWGRREARAADSRTGACAGQGRTSGGTPVRRPARRRQADRRRGSHDHIFVPRRRRPPLETVWEHSAPHPGTRLPPGVDPWEKSGRRATDRRAPTPPQTNGHQQLSPGLFPNRRGQTR